ncbi:MAG: outer membrane beta-barrel protein, partial [Cetobacterium sp.]
NYSTKIDDGFYYGVGTGMEYNNFTVDIMYQANQAKVKGTVDGATDSHKKSLDYSRVTLGFGYKFSY